MSKTGKALTIILMCGLMFGTGSAIYSFTHQTADTGFDVTSQVALTFDSSSFEFESVDTTVSSFEQLSYVNLSNQNSDLLMNVTITETIGDVVDSCDGTGDLASVVSYNGTTLSSGDQIIVPSGESWIEVLTTAKKYSCEGNITTAILIEPSG